MESSETYEFLKSIIQIKLRKRTCSSIRENKSEFKVPCPKFYIKKSKLFNNYFITNFGYFQIYLSS